MLFVLSPAKALDYDTPAHPPQVSQPAFLPQARSLIEVLRQRSATEIADLMDLSPALAALNVARYQAWSLPFTPDNAKPAVLAFNGDVYEGLAAATLGPDHLLWLQDHLCILSGLYGVLRPLDLMQAYRLEMGTRLATERGPHLYRFWGTALAEYLRERALAQAAPCVVNLASEEYFKAVDRRALGLPVLTCVFEEYRQGRYKVVGFAAKRARGLMMRYAAEQRITAPEPLQGFAAEGYAYDPSVSSTERWVFRRHLA